MKAIQLMSHLNYGDAIGNDVLALHQALQEMGYEALIMAQHAHERLRGVTMPVTPEAIGEGDVVLLHKASGDFLSSLFAGLPCKKVMIYHNITPPGFFLPYDPMLSWNQWRGRRQVVRIAKHVDAAWGDSCYNRDELVRLGVPVEKARVLPILMDFEKFQAAPDERCMAALRARRGSKLLFIGRIAPNKRQEDVIKAFAYYKRHDPQASLYLVGAWMGHEKYYAKLQGFIADAGIADVYMPGHVTDAEMLAYYRSADAFVCMSAHEGFCVPLLEAMTCQVPVLAYAATAVTETMGQHDLLFREKAYAAMGAALHRVVSDADFRAHILRQQAENLARYQPGRIKAQFQGLMAEITGREGKADGL